jgi:hypothetical protein
MSNSAEERSEIEDYQEEGAKRLSGRVSKAATASGVNSLCSEVIRMTHTARHWQASEEDKCIWGTGEKPLTVENHLEYVSVNGRVRFKWFKGTTCD